MNIKPIRLIFSILIGYVFGMFIFFFDNFNSCPSFDASFSHFPAAVNYPLLMDKGNPANDVASLSGEPFTQLWFFREQPLFLVWAIMHIIGAALCIAVIMINIGIQQEVFQRYVIPLQQRRNSVFTVVACVAIIMGLSYVAAYKFDYVAYLIPLNHSKLKILLFEGLNYLTGAYCLTNMMWITFIANNNIHSISRDEFGKLKKLFHICLFMVAIVIGYATFNSGVLYKALNGFYYVLYDTSGKSAPYFPVFIIIILGLVNTFLLSMFYFPNAQVFRNAEDQNALLVLPTHENKAGVQEAGHKGFFGITSEMVEAIKVVLALLAPLLSGLFS